MSRKIIHAKNRVIQPEIPNDRVIERFIEPDHPEVPENWQVGQLLNVRPANDRYVITLAGEEFDYRHPERAMKFESYVQCQNFVSKWYARTWTNEVT